MSTLRINNIEAQAVPASPSIDEKIKLTNSSGDVLVHVDGKTSGITTIGINTTAGNIKFDQNSNVLVTGIITATQFSGQITPTSLEIGSNIKLGNAGVITATSFVGSGANLTGISAGAGGDTGLDLNDNVKIRLGTGNDLEIFHDGTNSKVLNSTGSLITLSDEVRWKNTANNETLFVATANAGVRLFYDNTQRLETTAHGASITGKLDLSSDLDMGDNDFIKLGDGDDLTISHDATNSTIHNQTGNLRVRNAGEFQVTKSSTENMLIAKPDGAVELYHDNVKRFSTIGAGAYVIGSFGVGAATNPSHHYNQGIHVHAAGTGAVLHLTDNTSGSGAGDGFDILSNDGSAYLWQRENANMIFGTNGTSRWNIYGSNGHFAPSANNTYDIGTTSNRVRNIYTNDLNLSNEGSSNDVDGTWGHYTIQEGESDLFLINRRSGKKYKFNLTEVS